MTQKKYSRSSIFSVLLGMASAALTLNYAGELPLFAIVAGMAASGCGAAAIWSIRRAPHSLCGAGLAVLGATLGAIVTAFSVLILASMSLQQFNQDQRRQPSMDSAMRLQAVLSRNTLSDQPATNFTSNLPIVVIDTAGQTISKEAQVVVRAKFFDATNGRVSVSAKADYDGLATIHLHGHTTLYLPKRSYTFHTVDNETNPAKVSLLGLPKEDSWVLYAPFEDKTLMRDVLAFELARKMGHYAPRTRFVELFVRTSDRTLSMRDYTGVYVLIEKIKRGKDRVNIAKLGPEAGAEPDITGGYIIKRDHSERRESRFHTGHGGPYFYVYPKADEITAAQKSWLAGYFNSFEVALYGEDFADPKSGYAAYLDVDSFIDAHWLIELSKNVDGFRYSAYLTKERGGKIKTEPLWDWNRSFGNANYYGGWQVHGWYWAILRPNEISWYLRLRQDPAFVLRSTVRWFELRNDVLDPAKISARIDELAAQLEEAQQRNYQRWPVLGQQITCNYYVGQSFQDEVRWMKNWIAQRIAWIDSVEQRRD